MMVAKYMYNNIIILLVILLINFKFMDNQEQQKETPIKDQSIEDKKNNVSEIDNDKMWAIIAYFIFFLPLIVIKKRSTFLNYHINQGLTLLIVSIIGNVIFNNILRNIIILGQLWSLLIIIMLIIGIINANKKEIKPLPIIGKFFDLIK